METFGILENWSLRRCGHNWKLDCACIFNRTHQSGFQLSVAKPIPNQLPTIRLLGQSRTMIVKPNQNQKNGLTLSALNWTALLLTGPLHDPVTWYKITHTGEQVAQWNFQNKGRCIVLEVPLCNVLTSMCNFVPCYWVMQRPCHEDFAVLGQFCAKIITLRL